LILNLSNKQNILKSETTLKYFIISSITSSLFLIGFSYLYYFTGSLNLNEILLFSSFFKLDLIFFQNQIFIISIFCIILSLIIKLGLFPFHNWLLDLYNGFSYNLIFIMFILQKPILFFLLFKIYNIFNFIIILNFFILQLILVISIFSILLGSIGIILQSNIKKFIAYSSLITNSYLLLLLLNNFYFFDIFFIIFLIIYNLNNFLLFFFFQNINQIFNKVIKNLIEIYNLYYINKNLSIFFIIILFSFLGLPPFSGFFSKYLILYILNLNNFLTISIFILILNLLSSFYYLRLIKFLNINEKFFYYINSLYFLNNNKNLFFINFTTNLNFEIFFFFFLINLYLFCKIDFFIYFQKIYDYKI
jgi:NADH-quinone oxidoreductase subunit N